MTRQVLDAEGNVVVEITMLDTTTEEEWQVVLSAYQVVDEIVDE